MTKFWTDDAWEEFEYWLEQDKKTLRQIKKLLKDIDRNGYVYKIEDGMVKIIQCGSHYKDK